jgi:hypothetical protein
MTMLRITAVTEDGAVFEAPSYQDLVYQMKLDAWVTEQTKEDYMGAVARRSEIYNGQRIQYHDAQTFIHELVRIGVIVELNVRRVNK